MKITQVATVQGSMSTMQDQATEIATQMKETKARCESLEEDLADANRLLQERSREADTMRRLLNEAESRNEARFRDVKAKMDSAFEERDKAEEEIATIGRSRAKEIEELRNRIREAERVLKKAEEAKEVTERERKEYQSGKQAAESKLEPVMRELEETKKANEQMRDALDKTERQMQTVEQRGVGARRELEELRARYEKLFKSHKALQDEHRNQSLRGRPATSTLNRTSIDSVRSSATRVMSPTGAANGASNTIALTGTGGPHHVNADYLKNVILQFLEKDKKMQMQLIPVLSHLLKFNGEDVSKWEAAVNAR